MGLPELIIVLVTPLVLVGLFVVPFLRVGIDHADEGYLVYGTVRLLEGQVPIRDFRAYDPGRYYWCGLFALIFGSGHYAVRLAMAAASALALGVVASVVLSATQSPLLSVAACGLALIWMQPRHKQLENLLTVLGICVLFNLFEDASATNYALLGTLLGVSVFFGLNSAVYLAGAGVLMSVLVLDLPTLRAVNALCLGLGIGLLPVIALVIGVRGYAQSYWRRKVVALVKRGTTNLKQPLPWSWTAPSTGFKGASPRRRAVLRWLFTLMPLLFIMGLSFPLVIAPSDMGPPEQLAFTASCVGIVNFYHTLSRADLGHMFLPLLPLGILFTAGTFIVFGAMIATILVLMAVLGSAWLVWQQPFHLPRYAQISCGLEVLDTAADRFLLPEAEANHLRRLHRLTEHWSDGNDPILAVPLQIGLCALFGRPHAAYDSFPVYPSEAPARAAMQADIGETTPKIMLIGKTALDQRDELIFLRNYPDVSVLIAEKYRLVEVVGSVEVYVRADLRESAPSDEAEIR